MPSLQCLISALTPAGGGDLLFGFACSVVLWGGRGTADKCHWPVWGGPAVFRPHWVCPTHGGRVCFPRLHCSGFRLLYRERVLHKSEDLVAPAFLCLPHPSSSGSQELDWSTLPGCGAPSPLSGPSLSFLARLSLGAPCVWSLAATVPEDVNHPESQEVFG